MKRILAVLFLGAAVLPLPAMNAARAQDEAMDSREGIALQNQVLELRRDVETLQAQLANGAPPQAVYRGAAPEAGGGEGGGGNDLTAQLLGRVQTLEDQVRSLRGDVDELKNQTQRQQADLAKQLSDMQFQAQQGGGQPGSPAAAPSAPAQIMSPPPGSLSLPGQASASAGAAASRHSPDQMMQDASAALARRDYAAAEAAAREVLSSGHGAHAYDAQFLLAQAEAGQRNYQAAAVAYDDTYNRSHGGARAQDSLLGLANALYNLGDKGAACGALNKLRAQFPSPRSDIRESANNLHARAGCG